MNQKILQDFIEREQAENLPKAQDWETRAIHQITSKTRYNVDYYHGYYNGYLTALANLKILLANNKDTP